MFAGFNLNKHNSLVLLLSTLSKYLPTCWLQVFIYLLTHSACKINTLKKTHPYIGNVVSMNSNDDRNLPCNIIIDNIIIDNIIALE